MSRWINGPVLIGFVAIIYASVAADFLNQRKYWDALIWTGYVIANIGFIGKYLAS